MDRPEGANRSVGKTGACSRHVLSDQIHARFPTCIAVFVLLLQFNSPLKVLQNTEN